jgi:hypothetical protein
MNTTGNDSNALFDYLLIAYGGKDIVTKDGRLHVDDPQVRGRHNLDRGRGAVTRKEGGLRRHRDDGTGAFE